MVWIRFYYKGGLMGVSRGFNGCWVGYAPLNPH